MISSSNFNRVKQCTSMNLSVWWALFGLFYYHFIFFSAPHWLLTEKILFIYFNFELILSKPTNKISFQIHYTKYYTIKMWSPCAYTPLIFAIRWAPKYLLECEWRSRECFICIIIPKILHTFIAALQVIAAISYRHYRKTTSIEIRYLQITGI